MLTQQGSLHDHNKLKHVFLPLAKSLHDGEFTGIQAQTAECLVVGEVVTQHMVVVLNKVTREWMTLQSFGRRWQHLHIVASCSPSVS